MHMVHFVGAGPGAPDLITRRGAAFLQAADCIIYAGSLVNPALLGLAKPDCTIYNSAEMTLEQVLDVMRRMEAAGKTTVRLHTGDPCLYGAIREQMDALTQTAFVTMTPPVFPVFCGAAAALNAEYYPAHSQPDGHHPPEVGGTAVPRRYGRTGRERRRTVTSVATDDGRDVVCTSSYVDVGVESKYGTATAGRSVRYDG